MKKTYMTPEVMIVTMTVQQMIAGSPAGTSTNTKMEFGSNAGDGVSGDSRRVFWDDDDDDE